MPENISEQNHWDEFRSSMDENQEKNAPVKRKVPKSEEPPTAVLFRDYFWTLMAASFIFPSILYWATGLMFWGALTTSAVIANQVEEKT